PKSFDGFRIRGKLASLEAADLAAKRPALAKERLDEAISLLRTADTIRPFQASVLAPLGRSLWAAGQQAEAEKLLLSAVEHNQDVPNANSEERLIELDSAYSELNRMYSKLGRLADEERILKRAIADNAGNSKRFLFLADIAGLYRDMGRKGEMTKTLEEMKPHAAEFPLVY